MTYITDEEISNLPHDHPYEAFTMFEGIVHKRYQVDFDNLDDEKSDLPIKRLYMSHVLSAADHFEILEIKRKWDGLPPSSYSWDQEASVYSDFMSDVAFLITGFRLRIAKRAKTCSVALDLAVKTKLNHLISQLRLEVEKTSLNSSKKHRILSKLADLQKELDNERTKIEELGLAFVEICSYIGDGSEKLEPAVRLIERIGAAIGIAVREEEEERKQLPNTKLPKKIEQTKSNVENKNYSFEKSLDDEIPF